MLFWWIKICFHNFLGQTLLFSGDTSAGFATKVEIIGPKTSSEASTISDFFKPILDVMEGSAPFDESLFNDYTGTLPGTSTLLCKSDRVHSIQVMLGLPHGPHDMPEPPHGHDITVMFQHQHQTHHDRRKDDPSALSDTMISQGILPNISSFTLSTSSWNNEQRYSMLASIYTSIDLFYINIHRIWINWVMFGILHYTRLNIPTVPTQLV